MLVAGNGTKRLTIYSHWPNTIYVVVVVPVGVCALHFLPTQGVTLGRQEEESDPFFLPTKPAPYYAVKQVSCGYSHNAAVDTFGHVYVWGTSTEGKLGIQEAQAIPLHAANAFGIPLECEIYCVVPTLLRFPHNNIRVRQVSCGSVHTAAVTTDGHLYTWGCANGGRLGLGPKVLSNVKTPTFVHCLRKRSVQKVDCGYCHTVVLTAIVEHRSDEGIRTRSTKGTGVGVVADEDVAITHTGGGIFSCGAAGVAGAASMRTYFERVSFAAITDEEETAHHVCDVADDPKQQTVQLLPLPKLKSTIVARDVSCGNQHSAIVTTEGELYTWGMNTGGCLGHPLVLKCVVSPRRVECMYRSPSNIARKCAFGKGASQSSTYNKHGPSKALNGDTKGNGEAMCTHTQFEDNAWWEVDLGHPSVIDCIRIWNRTDTPLDGSAWAKDEYQARLLPCWVFIGESPFALGVGPNSLTASKSAATMSKYFKARDPAPSVLEWKIPVENVVGR